mmetsp:Transcript_85781/g.260394  ORF Transcript_85781/g.260394 Transcript_85781/m.260394 type:complete len:322 (+) Transcript_85781:507-1472(+)
MAGNWGRTGAAPGLVKPAGRSSPGSFCEALGRSHSSSRLRRTPGEAGVVTSHEATSSRVSSAASARPNWKTSVLHCNSSSSSSCACWALCCSARCLSARCESIERLSESCCACWAHTASAATACRAARSWSSLLRRSSSRFASIFCPMLSTSRLLRASSSSRRACRIRWVVVHCLSRWSASAWRCCACCCASSSSLRFTSTCCLSASSRCLSAFSASSRRARSSFSSRLLAAAFAFSSSRCLFSCSCFARRSSSRCAASSSRFLRSSSFRFRFSLSRSRGSSPFASSLAALDSLRLPSSLLRSSFFSSASALLARSSLRLL